MKNFLKLFTVLFAVSLEVQAGPTDDLVGSWCFFEQEYDGQKTAEKVDITLKRDGSYLWQEGPFEQAGTWSLDGAKLNMTNVGTHTVLSVTANELQLRRMSLMKFSKGKCDKDSFGPADITLFHNAAATGDLKVIRQYIERGIDINVVDFDKGDTALIKSAKFCKVDIAEALLGHGANKAIMNEDGKTAADYAKTSRFHKGCSALVAVGLVRDEN